MSETIKRNGPARTGSLYWTKSGWRARLRVDVDGVTVQKSYDLETRDKAAARVKLRRLVKLNAPPETEQAAAPITVAEFAETWLTRREALGIAAVSYERRYFERVWRPAIGPLPLRDVTKAHVQEVVDAVAAGEIRQAPRREDDRPERYSRQSIAHMRATIVRLFEAAWKDELVAENKAAKTEIPDIDEETKARTVLTDTEIGQLLAHPKVDAEIKLLVLLSRTLGGLRAGDLNALDWTAFSPGFATCTFVRRKTRKKRPAPQTLIVPEPVRAFLGVWRERQGCPEAGPVFPIRRGRRAGEAKKRSNMSYADRLRRELLRAGVARHELHHETPTTLPVDFHSTRRAYATALARVGVNEQMAKVLTGHADGKTHQRYLASLIGELPAAALPELSIDHAQLLRKATNKNHNLAIFPERDTGLEPVTPSLGSSCSTN
jgi:integrase